jgi:hypothetical protein
MFEEVDEGGVFFGVDVFDAAVVVADVGVDEAGSGELLDGVGYGGGEAGGGVDVVRLREGHAFSWSPLRVRTVRQGQGWPSLAQTVMVWPYWSRPAQRGSWMRRTSRMRSSAVLMGSRSG